MIIHLNLISHQLIPNIIGTFSNTEKDMKVFLILGDTSLQERAQLLEDFYREKGITDIETINCQTSYNHAKIYRRAQALYQQIKIDYPDAMIALNATGGTKAMSIAFTQVFDDLTNQSMAYYTDTTEKQNLILTNPDKNTFEPLPFKSVLNIDDYLLLNKFKVDSQITINNQEHDHILSRKKAISFLVELCNKDVNIISLLNREAQKTNFGSNNKKFCPTVETKLFSKLKIVCKKLAEFSLLEVSDNTLTFANKDAARFIGGIWLEEYAYLCAHEVGIEHIAMSVEGHWLDNKNNESRAKNELDLILIENNHILIIECKTCNWNQEGKGQDTTLKLDSLMHNLGGSHAKSMLLSVFNLDPNTDERVKNLKGIELVASKSMLKLTEHFKKWQADVS